MADRPYRNALDLSVLHMKPQMVKARLADSSKVHNCACSPLAMSTLNTSETGNLSLSLSLSLGTAATNSLECIASRATRRQARLMPMKTSFGASSDSSNSFVVRPFAASAYCLCVRASTCLQLHTSGAPIKIHGLRFTNLQSLCSPGVTYSGANLTGLRSAKERARETERKESGRVIIR